MAEKFPLAKRVIMVSPPADFVDFGFLGYSEKIRMVITGTRDDIADLKTVERMLPRWNPEAVFHPIEGADHFYWGKTEELKKAVQGFLEYDEP
jgi:alpha/beta superfamily hydrolase